MQSKLSLILAILTTVLLGACTAAAPSTGTPVITFAPSSAPLAEEPTLSPEPVPLDPVTLSAPLSIHTIHMLDETRGWAIGSAPELTADQPASAHDLILITSDGGRTWTDVSPPESFPEGSLQADAAFIDSDHAWVVYTGSSMVWSTSDGGATWTTSPALPAGMMGSRFFALDSQNGWLLRSLEAGMSQVWEALFRTASGGASWQIVVDPYNSENFCRFSKTGWHFLDTSSGWMTHNSHGVSASIYFQGTTDGGLTWGDYELQPPAELPDLFEESLCWTHSPQLYNPGEGLVALSCTTMEPGEAFHYLYSTTDDGSNWTITPYPGGDLYFLPENVIFAADQQLAKSPDRGTTWEVIGPLEWDAQFNFISSELIFAAARIQEIHSLFRSDDAGQTWDQLEPVLLQPDPADFSTGETPAAPDTGTGPFTGEFAFLSYRANPENYDLSDLYLASMQESEPTRLTESGSMINSFDWDPTGTMIVLSSDLDGDRELYLMPLNSGEWQRLTRNETSDRLPAFSPDGRQIAYVTGSWGSEQVHLYDLSTQGSRLLAPGTTPAWSPDGSTLLIFRENDGLYSVDPETGGELRLIDSSGNGLDHFPAFSPSGNLLLAASNRHSPGDYLVEAPWLFEADGTPIGRVGTGWGSPPYAWLPDGSGLLVTSDFLMLAQLRLLDLNGGLQDLPLDDPSGWFPRIRPGT